MNKESERWLDQVRVQLDQDARDLDASTASRLNRARQRALDAGLRPRRDWRWSWVALTTAAAVVLTLAVVVRTPVAETPAPSASIEESAADFDMLAGTEDLEMIENLEFYAWLEQQSLDG